MPRKSPSYIWYLLPIFFGIIGGVVGYVAVRDQDKGMAKTILIIPFVIIGIVIVTIGLGMTIGGLTFSNSMGGVAPAMIWR